MNFTDVSSITIPEGDVLQIVNSQNVTLWQKQTGPDYTEPFYVENTLVSAKTVQFVKAGSQAILTIEVEYSFDRETWTSLGTITTTPLNLTLHAGQKAYIRATTPRWGTSGSGRAVILGCPKVGGNIMSLLYGASFTGQETNFPLTSTWNFRYLFRENTDLVDASKLLFPCTALTERCYAGLFLNCTSLQYGPEFFPTPSEAYLGCYAEIFNGCSSVTKVPDMNLAVLPERCYDRLYQNCANLNKIVCLATDISANLCTSNWTNGVAATGTFYCASGMSQVWSTGTSGIPSGWTVVEV